MRGGDEEAEETFFFNLKCTKLSTSVCLMTENFLDLFVNDSEFLKRSWPVTRTCIAVFGNHNAPIHLMLGYSYYISSVHIFHLIDSRVSCQ